MFIVVCEEDTDFFKTREEAEEHISNLIFDYYRFYITENQEIDFTPKNLFEGQQFNNDIFNNYFEHIIDKKQLAPKAYSENILNNVKTFQTDASSLIYPSPIVTVEAETKQFDVISLINFMKNFSALKNIIFF